MSDNNFDKDFPYILQNQEKAKVCFGSVQERKKAGVFSRFGVAYTSKPSSNLSPGMYYTPTDVSIHRPISNKGTVLGDRTAKKQPRGPDIKTPSPCSYSIPNQSVPRALSFKGVQRFKRHCNQGNVGPGYYNVSRPRMEMKFAYSFGGKRKLIPVIKVKCGPVNLDMCDKCKQKPVGDYWYWTPQLNGKKISDISNSISLSKEFPTFFLCRVCHQHELQEPKIFSKQQIQQFKKIRDCSQIHFHNGCEARLLLTPPRDIEKIKEKEAYLAMYFQ